MENSVVSKQVEQAYQCSILKSQVAVLQRALLDQKNTYDKEKEQYLKNFREFRNTSEEIIQWTQRSCYRVLINIFNDRKVVAVKQHAPESILKAEHDRIISEMQMQNKKQFRELQESKNNQISNLQSELQLKNQIYDELQKINVGKLDIMNQSGILQSSRASGFVNLQDSIPTALEPGKIIHKQQSENMKGSTIQSQKQNILQTFMEQNYKNISENKQLLDNYEHTESFQLANAMPWIIAVEKVQNDLVQKHSAVLIENQNMRQQLTELVRIAKDGKNMIEQNAELKQQIEQLRKQIKKQDEDFFDLNSQKVEDDKRNQSQLQELQNTIQKLKQQLYQQDANKDYQHIQLKSTVVERNTPYQQAVNNDDIKNQQIGDLQQQVISMKNFEYVYNDNVKLLTDRLVTVNSQNDELRLIQIKFNEKITEQKKKMHNEILTQLQPLIDNGQATLQKIMNDNEKLQKDKEFMLQAIRATDYQKSALEEQVKLLKKINEQFKQNTHELNNQYVILQKSNDIMARQLMKNMNERDVLKMKVNDSIAMIKKLQEYHILKEVKKDKMLNALKIALYEAMFKWYEQQEKTKSPDQQSIDFIKKIIKNSVLTPINNELLKIDLDMFENKESSEFDEDDILTILKKKKLNEENINEKSKFEIAFREQFAKKEEDQEYDIKLLNIDSKETQYDVICNTDKQVQYDQIIKVDDFQCQVVIFNEDNELLKKAYQTIEQNNKQIEKYNQFNCELGQLKSKLFNEIYQDDIKMITRWKGEMQMMKEDLRSTQLKMYHLAKEKRNHRCKTFQDFKGQVDNMLNDQKDIFDKQNHLLEIQVNQSQKQSRNLMEQLNYSRNQYMKVDLFILNLKKEQFNQQELQKRFIQISGISLSIDKILARVNLYYEKTKHCLLPSFDKQVQVKPSVSVKYDSLPSSQKVSTKQSTTPKDQQIDRSNSKKPKQQSNANIQNDYSRAESKMDEISKADQEMSISQAIPVTQQVILEMVKTKNNGQQQQELVNSLNTKQQITNTKTLHSQQQKNETDTIQLSTLIEHNLEFSDSDKKQEILKPVREQVYELNNNRIQQAKDEHLQLHHQQSQNLNISMQNQSSFVEQETNNSVSLFEEEIQAGTPEFILQEQLQMQKEDYYSLLLKQRFMKEKITYLQQMHKLFLSEFAQKEQVIKENHDKLVTFNTVVLEQEQSKQQIFELQKQNEFLVKKAAIVSELKYQPASRIPQKHQIHKEQQIKIENKEELYEALQFDQSKSTKPKSSKPAKRIPLGTEINSNRFQQLMHQKPATSGQKLQKQISTDELDVEASQKQLPQLNSTNPKTLHRQSSQINQDQSQISNLTPIQQQQHQTSTSKLEQISNNDSESKFDKQQQARDYQALMSQVKKNMRQIDQFDTNVTRVRHSDEDEKLKVMTLKAQITKNVKDLQDKKNYGK